MPHFFSVHARLAVDALHAERAVWVGQSRPRRPSCGCSHQRRLVHAERAVWAGRARPRRSSSGCSDQRRLHAVIVGRESKEDLVPEGGGATALGRPPDAAGGVLGLIQGLWTVIVGLARVLRGRVHGRPSKTRYRVFPVGRKEYKQ